MARALMAEDGFDHIDELFAAALSRPPEERSAFLQERCEDPAVRKEVVSLIRAYEEGGNFFEEFGNVVDPLGSSHLESDVDQSGTSARSDPLDLEGEGVAGYVVEEHLGGGGMGLVYRARDRKLDRPVALKFLPPHLAGDSEAARRFEREGRAAASLEHPHIATVYEAGRTETGRPYLAMAYYEGDTLEDKLENGALPLEEAVSYARQIAGALGAAHQAGIVHRDIKPANVLVTQENEVKVLDFGLAHLVDGSGLTDPGRRLGTAAYMSPEQARGEAIDERTDLWSLGVVLFEMLAGRRPFSAERKMALLRAVVDEEPAALRDHRPEVPSELARIVKRCLAKDPEERYGSANELLEELEAVGPVGRARTGEGGGTLGSSIHGDRVRSSIIPIGGVLLLLAAGLYLYGQMIGSGAGRSGNLPGLADTTEVSDRSIAVLPFENIGGERSAQFAQGVHDGLVTRLSNVSDLQVISRTSVMPYRTTEKTVPEIARELGVQWVIEGTVQQAGGLVQVDAKLVRAEEDVNRWARSYQRELTPNNLFAIQSQLTRKIARSLEAELGPGERERINRHPTEDLDAYRLYVQGRQQLARRRFGEWRKVREAIGYFRQALEQDSSFALAWAGLADAATFYPGQKPDSAGALAISQEFAARRALELAPDLAEARAAMGHVHLRNMNAPAARRELRRALELKPSYWGAHHWLGELYLHIGRFEEAMDHVTLAVELNPRHARARHWLYDAYNFSGRPHESLEAARRQQRMNLEQERAVGGEVRALISLGRLEQARTLAEKQIAKLPVETGWGGWFRAYLVDICAELGDTTQARRYLIQIRRAQKPPKMLAWAYMGIGATEQALTEYERLEPEDWGQIGAVGGLHFWKTEYPSLRENPQYLELIREANKAWDLRPNGVFPREEEIASGVGQ